MRRVARGVRSERARRTSRRRAGLAALAVATVALAAGCSDQGTTTTRIDQAAFARRIERTTDFDAGQSRCIAEQSFRSFDADTIETLYEKGIEPLRLSLAAQQYAAILVTCAYE